MKKGLKRIEYNSWHFKDGKKIEGAPSDIRGNLTGIRGNLDDCEITQEDRKIGIKIEDLVL